MPPDLNGRLDFWNIGYPLGAAVYLTAVVAIAAVAWALYRRSRIWRLGALNPDVGPWARAFARGCGRCWSTPSRTGGSCVTSAIRG